MKTHPTKVARNMQRELGLAGTTRPALFAMLRHIIMQAGCNRSRKLPNGQELGSWSDMEILKRVSRTRFVPKLFSRLDLNPAHAAVAEPKTARLTNNESVDWILRYRAELCDPRG